MLDGCQGIASGLSENPALTILKFSSGKERRRIRSGLTEAMEPTDVVDEVNGG